MEGESPSVELDVGQGADGCSEASSVPSVVIVLPCVWALANCPDHGWGVAVSHSLHMGWAGHGEDPKPGEGQLQYPLHLCVFSGLLSVARIFLNDCPVPGWTVFSTSWWMEVLRLWAKNTGSSFFQQEVWLGGACVLPQERVGPTVVLSR